MSTRSVKAKKEDRAMAIAAISLCLVIFYITLLPLGEKNTIWIATKPMTEQYILGEMLDLLIEQDTDLSGELTQGGGTSNIQSAMENGEFDIYPEYTGTGWNMALKFDDICAVGDVTLGRLRR